MNEKRFDEWNYKKQTIHFGGISPLYHEREIWWMSIGENIGSETNGKGENFLRPILVVRKYGDLFFGIPLSSQVRFGMWYEQFEYKNRIQCVLLSQSGKYSSFRLRRKMGRIPIVDFIRICEALQRLLFKK